MGITVSNIDEEIIDAVYSDDVENLSISDDKHSRTLLHVAAWSDDPELLPILLEKECDVNVKDSYGWTALMVSMYKGNIQNVYTLLQKSAEFEPNTQEASWLLHHAIQNDLIAIASLLLEKSTKFGSYESSILNIAVDNHSPAMVKLLLEKGHCNPNILDENGWAPLHLASGHDNIAVAKILIEFNANVNLKDSKGNTPLAWAIKYGGKHVEAELEKYQAEYDGVWNGDGSGNEDVSVDVELEDSICFASEDEYINLYRINMLGEKGYATIKNEINNT
ncbi:hypothetical protein GJ496_006840 [Pomphorhynchus laevis]|nr:hypothetical protein GJ496_006840 [Pomphorhynchus laevis]